MLTECTHICFLIKLNLTEQHTRFASYFFLLIITDIGANKSKFKFKFILDLLTEIHLEQNAHTYASNLHYAYHWTSQYENGAHKTKCVAAVVATAANNVERCLALKIDLGGLAKRRIHAQ